MSIPLLLFFTFLLYRPEVQDLDKTHWLLGTWVNHTARGEVFESWKKQADGSLAGKSYAVKGADTLVFETVLLAQEKDALYYIPTVPNQNQGQPVRFKGTRITAEDLTFENPEHDFPQRITYTRIKSDSLVAEIYGTRNGQERKQTFPMIKLK
jgi:hypothetical protein